MICTVLELLDLREFTGDLTDVLAAPEEAPGPIDAVRATQGRSRGPPPGPSRTPDQENGSSAVPSARPAWSRPTWW